MISLCQEDKGAGRERSEHLALLRSEADELLEFSLRYFQHAGNGPSLNVLSAKETMASYFMVKDDFDKAIQLMVAEVFPFLSRESELYGIALSNYSLMLSENGELVKALKVREEEIELAKLGSGEGTLGGPDSLDVAVSYFNAMGICLRLKVCGDFLTNRSSHFISRHGILRLSMAKNVLTFAHGSLGRMR